MWLVVKVVNTAFTTLVSHCTVTSILNFKSMLFSQINHAGACEKTVAFLYYIGKILHGVCIILNRKDFVHPHAKCLPERDFAYIPLHKCLLENM